MSGPLSSALTSLVPGNSTTPVNSTTHHSLWCFRAKGSLDTPEN
uniref:Uncharacterized protein n=1 Tax=Rhizophora mucronata TaxID=61149 RepID=A0A2P2PK35_RHIMU